MPNPEERIEIDVDELQRAVEYGELVVAEGTDMTVDAAAAHLALTRKFVSPETLADWHARGLTWPTPPGSVGPVGGGDII